MFMRVGVVLPLVLSAFAAVPAPTAVAAVGDPVLIAVGDIACDPAATAFQGGQGTATECQQLATSDLAVAAAPDAVAVLGDNAYECGSTGAFQGSYEPSWGRLIGITHPVVGNHEYKTAGPADTTTGCTAANTGAAGYFDYFGARAGTRGEGWYSYDLGAWHVVALNSNCTLAGGCSATSPQGKWLTADLAANPAACTLAYWHHPLFASGGKNNPAVLPLTKLLYNAGAELVLNGHTHWYERLAPTDPAGVLDPARGMRELVIGSGGVNHSATPSASTVNANTEALNTTAFGVAGLTLRPGSYDWKFTSVPGGPSFSDSGSATCHAKSADTTAPSVPTGLAGQRTPSGQVTLTWAAATDDTRVAGYRVLRDGVPVGYTDGATTWTDTKAAAATTYSYAVQAFDASENQSQASLAVSVPPSGGGTGGTGTLTVIASADAKLVKGQPDTNFGAVTGLVADATPQVRSLLRFPVTGVGTTSAVTKATLRLWTTNASPVGGSVAGTNGATWTEAGVTWNNQPAPGTPVATLGPVTAGSFVDVDVTSLVKGDGTVDLSLTTSSTDSVTYSSREATATRRPRLVLTVG